MRLALVASGILAFVTASSQGPYWAKDFGGLSADVVNDVKVDASGNLYVIGEFSLSLTYDGQTIVSAGATDVFVARIDDAGGLAWLVRAGGPGIDRGLKLHADGSGVLAVTGQFTGTADLFGSSFTSFGSTQDVFTAILDAASGSTNWIRVGGAALASDRPYGITRSPNGNITVAGDFRGNADFDGTIITSAFDPLLAAPGFDVFIASYDAGGTLLWLQQGTATHSDRAIDVVSDASNNLYVCGQFSDTITFDATHTNAMTNASFLVKFDAAGAEQWFRRFGGASFQHVRDMQLTSSNDLVLCGDQQGTATFFDLAPDDIVSADPFAYYLLRVDLSGEHLGHALRGSTDPLSVSALDQRGSKVCVFGSFDCQFTGLSTFYSGTGLFMATGPEDLFIARHDFPSLTLTDAQQFGGQHTKYAGGLASVPNGSLVFSGGYVRLLVFPSDGAAWADVQSVPNYCPLTSVNDGMTYCGSAEYGEFAANNSFGGIDGFVARAFVTGRPPYDAWNRNGSTGCDRSALEPCLMHTGVFPACPDTILLCTPGALYALWADPIFGFHDLAFSYWEDEYPPCGPPPGDSTAYVGWDVQFQWSTGASVYTIIVSSPGWYWCTVSASNGCFTWTDSVYVEFEPSTVPLISDGYGINVAAPPITTPLECVPPVWVWVTNVPPGYTVEWNGGVSDDSLFVDESGVYIASLISPGGCEQTNYIEVVIGEGDSLPNYTGVEAAWNIPDTIVQCPNSLVIGAATLTWYLDGLPAGPDTSLMVHVTNGSTGYYATMSDDLTWFVQVFSSGWTMIDITIEVFDPPCGLDTLTFQLLDSIYVEMVPWSNATIGGAAGICPGDTVPLVLQCTGCSSITWSGPGIISISPNEDTIWVAQPGIYMVTVSGSIGGLVCPSTVWVWLQIPDPPLLLIDPNSGIVCPGDTAIISTPYVAALYQWTGPLGALPVNNDSIAVTEPGEYFLTTTDAGGCELFNGPITLDVYGTPYISVAPDAVLCPGDGPVDLTIVAAPGAVIDWNAPLSGSSPFQTVSDTGTYSASVVSCGTSYVVSVTITTSYTNVVLTDPGPFTFCSGDSVLLEGPSGMTSYLWWPGGETSASIWVDQSGAYVLTAEEGTACAGTSDTVFVTVNTMPGLVSAPDVTICVGDTATIAASGVGAITWYTWPDGVTVIGTGAILLDGPLFENDTVIVSQAIGDCAGPQENVVVYVQPPPPIPVITGDTELCEGDTLVLTATSTPGVQFEWTTPAGTGSNAVFVVAPADLAAGGAYSVVASESGCESQPVSVNVVIAPLPDAPTITGDVDLCEGDALLLEASGPPGAQFTWSTPLGNGTGSTFAWAPVDQSAAGTYICFVTTDDCNGPPAAIEVIVDPCDTVVFFPNVISPNGDGTNDAFELEGYGGEVQLRIYNRWGNMIASLSGRKVKWDGRTDAGEPVSDGVYYWEAVVPVGSKTIQKAGYVQILH